MPVAAAGIRQPKTHTERFATALCSPTSLPAWKNVVPSAALLRWTENPCAHNINFKFPLSPVNEPPATTILHAQTLVSRVSFSRSNLQHVGATRHTVSALFRLLRLTVPLLFFVSDSGSFALCSQHIMNPNYGQLLGRKVLHSPPNSSQAQSFS